MEKVSKFLECYIPIHACNLRCNYCYVTQNNWWNAGKPDFAFVKKIARSFNKDRFGGPCMINLCATGETLLNEEVVKIINYLLADGHYVMVVTNGTITNRFEAFSNFPIEFRHRLFFKLSFHYLELKRMDLLNVFFDNIRLISKSEISYSVELTPDDIYIPYIDEIKKICNKEIGALCHITVPRDERKEGYPLMTSLSRTEFVNTWENFDSKLFDFKESIFEVPRHEFCYAGAWSLVIDLQSGNYSQCYNGKPLGNVYDDSPLTFLAVGNNCHEGHCFNGHAFLGFGLIPELKTPLYADMRNRMTSEGNEWLIPEMKEAMSTKLIEKNKEYTLSQKEFTNFLFNDDNKAASSLVREKIVDNLVLTGISNIAIYGYGKLGQRLEKTLSGTEISIKYIIDRKFKENKDLFLYDYRNIRNVDAIIVTPFYNQASIIKDIKRENVSVKIIAIQQLLDEV